MNGFGEEEASTELPNSKVSERVNLRGKKTKSSSKQQLDECFKMTHAQTETNLNSIINYLQKERKEERKEQNRKEQKEEGARVTGSPPHL